MTDQLREPPSDPDGPHGPTSLHRPLRIASCLTRNRLYRAPVLEGAGSGDDAAQTYLHHFETNAKAGVGLIIQGNSCVLAEGRSSPGMTLVHTRERMMAMKPMTDGVRRWGARIFLQIGHAGIYAMEGWHAQHRSGPLLAVSKPRIHVRAALVGVRTHVMQTQEVHELAERFGEVAGWAREAGYDGVQLASSNAKLIHQFLSPFYNRRTDEFGGTLRNRARILEVIAERVREHAGEDYPLTVKIPMGEESPPLTPCTSIPEGVEMARMAEAFGYHAITPVGLSVFPHASLCRGDDGGEIFETSSIRRRMEDALGGSRFKYAVVRWGYRRGAKTYPFERVWNRAYFRAAKAAISIPVFAVGGIRTLDDCLGILDAGEADMVGIGRPFYAEPDLPERLLDRGHALCESSNRCVPPQQLGLPARCYNPNVTRKKAAQRIAEREAADADAGS